MSSKKRVNAYLEEGLWTHAKRSGNASAYVSAVLQSHLNQVQSAIEHLSETGWTRNEVLAATEAIEATWLSIETPENSSVATHTALERNGAHKRRGIAEERWQKLIQGVREEKRTADALSAIAEEMTKRNHPVY